MKTILLTIALLTLAALSGLAVYQHRQVVSLRSQLAAASQSLSNATQDLETLAAASERIAASERKARILQETLTQSSHLSARQSEEMAALQTSLANAKTNTSAGGLSEMLKDPAMQDMIKAQQKAAIGPLIQRSYAALFTQLNLSPEQAAAMRDLLEQKMLSAADAGVSMLDGSLDATARTEMAKQIKAANDAFNDQLKQLLGDENYRTFETYEKTLGDRMSVGQFKDQIAGSGTALDPAQEQQLIQTLTDARSGFKWTTDFNQQNSGDINIAEIFSDTRLEQHAVEQAEFDRQLLQRAATFMRADQLAAYEKFLTDQRTMQIASMKLAAKMFQTPAK